MSYSTPVRIVIVLTLLLLATEISDVSAQAKQPSDEQLKEISKLKSDLGASLDRESDGVVVQPAWTKKAGAINEKSAKVKVTQKGLDETKALRDQINTAVAKDEYVASVAQTPAGDTKQVKQLEKQLKDQGKEADKLLVGAATNRSDENVGSAAGEEGQQGPNIIEGTSLNDGLDIGKLQLLETSKRRTKEMIKLKLVEEDLSFTLGEDVLEWEHIVHNGSEYFVGRRELDLLIVHKEASKYEPGSVLAVGKPITYLETYSFWNAVQQQQEGVILVAADSTVQWYRANQEKGQIELYWEWHVGTATTGLTHFTVDSRDYLVVSTNQSLRAGYYALNIYQYDLFNREFWIAQRMQLQHPCGRVTVLNTGRDILLGIVQNNTAAIYRYNPYSESSEHLRFELKQTFESEGIESVAAFQMGGRNYLALGGMQPQILLYQQGELVPKTILGHNFGLVDLFFPIPARTYRDDLLLLVQHRVDFSSHVLTVLETLVWDGESFEASIPVPCQLGNHFTYGVSCMLDIQRDEGLKGATLLRRGDEISVIVPRHKAESGLFRLHIELLQKNSELLDLQEIFEFLKDWVKEQDDLVAQATAFLAASAEEIEGKVPAFDALESLETPELQFDGEVQEILINDYKWTDEDTNTDLMTIINEIEQLEAELRARGQRQRRELPTEKFFMETLYLDNLDVNQLSLDLHNDEPFYIHNGSLTFDGVVNLESLEMLDDVSEGKETRQMSTLSVEIEEDLQFDEINGIKWQDIEDNLIFRTVPLDLDMLDVEGEVIMEDSLEIDTLNNLKFPEDYLWSSGPTTSTVTGEKIFTNTLSANAVDSDGLINGVNPFDAITLTEPQEWKGFPTFAHLEVSEQFELNGTARGRGLDNFPSNPTLADANRIIASCNFEELHVLGVLNVTGTFMSHEMESILGNVVQLPDNRSVEVPVSGNKSFADLYTPLDFHVGSNKINEINVEDFVTINTEQKLRIPSLKGYIYFHNLTTNGLFDGVNITELLSKSLKNDEPQFAPNTQLNFVNLLHAKEFSVLKSLNRVPLPDGYQGLDSDLSVGQVSFENMLGKVANIPKGLKGQGASLNGVNLKSFLEDRDWQAPGDTGNIYLQELQLGETLEVDKIYDIDMNYLMQFLDSVDDLPEMILEGKIQVDHIVVHGNVVVNQLNHKNFDKDVKDRVIWLNRENYLKNTLKFSGPVRVAGNLVLLGNFNDENLPDLIEDMVLRSPHGFEVIMAPKKFLGNVYVVGDSTADAINGVHMRYIATTKNVNNFNGTLKINGNLCVDDLIVEGTFNDFPMEKIAKLIRYDVGQKAFVVLGESEFTQSNALEDFTVLGRFNEIENLGDFFQNLVYRDQPILLEGRTTFSGRLTFANGASIKELNDLNLVELFSNIVLVNQAQPIRIDSPMVFKDQVRVYEAVARQYLKTGSISGCSLDQWLNDTVRVDRNENFKDTLHFAVNSVNGNFLLASSLNGINLNELITLHTAQNLSGDVEFSDVFLDGEIRVKGLVNNVDLAKEYANTVMIHGDQHITTPLTIQSFEVLGDLYTNVPVNGDKDLRRVAIVDGEAIRFESPLYFQNISAIDLQTHDLVAGINLTQWYDKALWLRNRPRQIITGNWSIRNLQVKKGPASHPSYMLNGWDYNDYMRSVEHDDDEYRILCSEVKKLVNEQDNWPFQVDKLEESFVVRLEETNLRIRKAFVLKNGTEIYLLVNTDCSTLVYQWLDSAFDRKSSFESGPIDQVALLPHEQGKAKYSLQFVTSYESVEPINCSMMGLNAWQVMDSDKKVTHLRSFEDLGSDQLLATSQKVYSSNGSVIHEVSISNETNVVEGLQDVQDIKDFHFLPRTANEESEPYLALTNGRKIMLLNKTELLRNKSTVRSAKELPETTFYFLIANETDFKLSYDDFKQVIARILNELVERLNQEVNVTQLSIPESDLYDEQLLQDFIGFMEELRSQQIFPKETFDTINWEDMELPGNPAQVLAARTTQIVWPVIVEIEEVHKYLQENATHEHPICACIMTNLGSLVSDVLVRANRKVAKEEEVSAVTESVIKRIREFEKDLNDMTEQLNEEIKEEIANRDRNPLLASSQAPNPSPADTAPPSNSSWLVLHKSHLPARGEGEMLSLSVGRRAQQRYLLAVIQYNEHSVGDLNDNVKLYNDHGLEGNSFQVIPAHKPRLLRSLRIRDEVLLIFVEHCCTVRVLIYRGIQGFVEFTRFQRRERIRDLLVLSLPNEYERHYLATVLEDRLVFYEFVVKGTKEMLLSELECD